VREASSFYHQFGILLSRHASQHWPFINFSVSNSNQIHSFPILTLALLLLALSHCFFFPSLIPFHGIIEDFYLLFSIANSKAETMCAI
jgi:hypothetical protein